MKTWFVTLPVAFSLIACRVDNSLPRNSCDTSADCLNGFACQEKVCVPVDGDGGGAGGCETFPPAACAQPLGMSHPIDRSELERLLPGRWLWCTGSMSAGMPVKFGRQDGIGFEFNDNATLWWVLVDDGNGVPVRATGFDAGGTVEFLADRSMLQINMVLSGNHWIGVVPEFTEGPPLRMRFTFSGASAEYVHDETQCGVRSGADMGGGSSDLASSGAFGAMCDPNVVLPTSCPAVGGVACSICGYANMAWQCLQPCHVGGSDCTSPQQCVALTESTLAGDCLAYDGYCS